MSNNSSLVEATAPTPKVCPACNTRYGQEVGFCSRDGTPLVVDPGAMHASLVGTVLAERYRIVSLLGEGGMGQVYEAQHVNINKRFALKLLRPEIVANQEAVARFRQEAWSASSIGHENIVEIDDFATLPNGAVYLAMEYLKGQALADRMRTPPPMTLGESLDVLMQLCRGLAAAHDKGIVHRDMKPENVFLAEKHGRVVAKILDFGIAKVSGAEGSQSLTRTGTIFGTPHYMSPEQALGRPLDHRTDIYSVGVIMYELFTGRVPFEAESFMGILTKHITVQPTLPRVLSPEREILPEVESVILRAMAKEVGDRYQTMAELIADLQQLAEVYAPGVLAHPSSSHSAQVSSQMFTPTPTNLPAARISSSMTPVPRPPSVKVPAVGSITGDDLMPARSSRVGVWVGVVVALAGLVAAVVLLTHKPPQIVTMETKPVAQPKPVEQPKTLEPPTTDPKPAASVTFLIDSEPGGAEILRDGSVFAKAPENIVLPQGKRDTIELRKTGYVSQTIELDAEGAGEKKRVVKLVRVQPVKPKETPLPPVVVGKKPVGPMNVPPPPLTTTKHHDPYGRVDEQKKGSDVLDPYK